MINIVGRQAYNRHSNLFYDFDERLVYISGCNLVLHYIREETGDENKDLDEDDDDIYN